MFLSFDKYTFTSIKQKQNKMPTITVYEPAKPVQIEIEFPAFRKWNSVYYMIINDYQCISVRCRAADDIGNPSIEHMNFLASHATCDESVAIPAVRFYEAYATARYQLDEITQCQIFELKQEAYHDDLIQDRQEAAEERKSMYENY